MASNQWLKRYWLIGVPIFIVSLASLCYAQTNTFPNDGSVGIGTTNPARTLDIIKTSNPTMRIWSTGATGDQPSFEFWSDFDTPNERNWAMSNAFDNGSFTFSVSPAKGADPYHGATAVMTLNKSGSVGIGTVNPTSKLHVAGGAKITGDLTVDGNIAAKYQDVAEWVRTPAHLAPGTVVVIDPLESNRVLPSSQSYDTRIAGVVSSQPGIILGEAGDDKAKVAHSGRVKVKADARFGSIEAGDLLVSSATAGYAMRSTPVEMNGISIHRPGTIVGKALEPLKEGQGEILVLLTLQ